MILLMYTRSSGAAAEQLRLEVSAGRQAASARPTPLLASSTSFAASANRLQLSYTLSSAMASTTAQPAAASPTSARSPAPVAVDSHSNRVDVINTKGGRVLCVSDIRGECTRDSVALSASRKRCRSARWPTRDVLGRCCLFRCKGLACGVGEVWTRVAGASAAV